MHNPLGQVEGQNVLSRLKFQSVLNAVMVGKESTPASIRLLELSFRERRNLCYHEVSCPVCLRSVLLPLIHT
jgi:hypothetical protein